MNVAVNTATGHPAREPPAARDDVAFLRKVGRGEDRCERAGSGREMKRVRGSLRRSGELREMPACVITRCEPAQSLWCRCRLSYSGRCSCYRRS